MEQRQLSGLGVSHFHSGATRGSSIHDKDSIWQRGICLLLEGPIVLALSNSGRISAGCSSCIADRLRGRSEHVRAKSIGATDIVRTFRSDARCNSPIDLVVRNQ